MVTIDKVGITKITRAEDESVPLWCTKYRASVAITETRIVDNRAIESYGLKLSDLNALEDNMRKDVLRRIYSEAAHEMVLLADMVVKSIRDYSALKEAMRQINKVYDKLPGSEGCKLPEFS